MIGNHKAIESAFAIAGSVARLDALSDTFLIDPSYFNRSTNHLVLICHAGSRSLFENATQDKVVLANKMRTMLSRCTTSYLDNRRRRIELRSAGAFRRCNFT